MKAVLEGANELCKGMAIGRPPADARSILIAANPVWSDDDEAWSLAPALVHETRRLRSLSSEAAADAAHFAAVRLLDELRRTLLAQRGIAVRR
jgi:hypothetical protein